MPKMKIFDWMYRKFHLNFDYNMLPHKNVELAQIINKEKTIMTEKDTLGLMTNKDKTLVDAFHGWQDGVLAIGTFGLDQLLTYQLHDEHYNVTEEEEDKEREEQVIEADGDGIQGEQNVKAAIEGEIVIEHETSTCQEIIECSGELKNEKTKTSVCRVTLADLFYADNVSQEDGHVAELIETVQESRKKSGHCKKPIRSLPKKLIPWKGADSRPGKKMQRLMTRILKRKIHPEFNSTGIGGDETDKSKTVDVPSANSESVLLLPGVALRP